MHFESGAKGRIRTADLRLMSPALYRLSYPGTKETLIVRFFTGSVKRKFSKVPVATSDADRKA